MSGIGLARDIAAWLLPLLVCCLAWPLIRRRRAYVVSAAVLSLTPLFVFYEGMGAFVVVWPLILCIPAYLTLASGSIWGLTCMALPIGLMIGLAAWHLSRWVVRNER